LDEVFEGFRGLTKDWPSDKGEIKGRLLSEEHFDSALAFYAEDKLLLDAVAIDLGAHDPPLVYEHKGGTASNIAKNIRVARRDSMKTQLQELESLLRAMSLPPYVQIVMMTELLENALRTNMRWLPLAAPGELSSFAWVIDGKDIAPTKMERLWSTLCLPWLETRSLSDPLLIESKATIAICQRGSFSSSRVPLRTSHRTSTYPVNRF